MLLHGLRSFQRGPYIYIASRASENDIRMGHAFMRFSYTAEAAKDHSPKPLQERKPCRIESSLGKAARASRKTTSSECKQHEADPGEH